MHRCMCQTLIYAEVKSARRFLLHMAWAKKSIRVYQCSLRCLQQVIQNNFLSNVWKLHTLRIWYLNIHLLTLLMPRFYSPKQVWMAISLVVECPPPNWKVGCLMHCHWMTYCSAPCVRAFTPTAPTKNIIQVCHLLWLNKSITLHTINKKKLGCQTVFGRQAFLIPTNKTS